MALTVLITGDRRWKNKELIRKELELLPSNTIIVHGACRGADLLAEEIAKEFGMTTRAFPAEWTIYGKAAGPIRNRQMIKLTNPQLVIAFHNDLENSKGTKNMVNLAYQYKIPVKVITENF